MRWENRARIMKVIATMPERDGFTRLFRRHLADCGRSQFPDCLRWEKWRRWMQPIPAFPEKVSIAIFPSLCWNIFRRRSSETFFLKPNGFRSRTVRPFTSWFYHTARRAYCGSGELGSNTRKHVLQCGLQSFTVHSARALHLFAARSFEKAA